MCIYLQSRAASQANAMTVMSGTHVHTPMPRHAILLIKKVTATIIMIKISKVKSQLITKRLRVNSNLGDKFKTDHI